jgi:hypothetical protein
MKGFASWELPET